MMIAMLLLGMLPLAVLPSIMSSSGADNDPDVDADDPELESEDMQTVGLSDFFDAPDVNDGSDTVYALAPVDPDAPDVAGDGDVDPSTVISPTDPDVADLPGDPVDPSTVLSPTVGDDTTAISSFGDYAVHTLTDVADAYSLFDDPDVAGDPATLSLNDGEPILMTDGTLHDVRAGDGDDVVHAGDEAAFIDGGAGNDRLYAGDGAAVLDGGDGADTLVGSASDALFLDGGAGDDMLIGGDGGEYLEGGDHDGTAASDNDTIAGGGGDDTIRGGYGADMIDGGSGDDYITHLGHEGERITAEHHEFAWHIDGDADTLVGGTGNDTIEFDSADIVTGGEGADTFWLYDNSDPDSGIAEITDFQSGEDFLRISLNPHAGYSDPLIEVGPADNGVDGVVMVDGEIVALLRGAADVDPSDIYVEIVDDVFPAGQAA